MMVSMRRINKIWKSRPTVEGAGVHLKRAFGNGQVPLFDPFLMLDDFRSDDPRYYLKGFPWHPHRGIETITYIIEGSVEHRDSMGNKGVIGPGDVQWMTAGNGIIHQEMPKGDKTGRMGGFQLWANLPASHKMIDPRYRDVKSSQIPEITMGNGVKIRVVCGEVQGTKGPVQDIITEPAYFDVTIPVNTEYIHPTGSGHTVFAYIIDGNARFGWEEKSHGHDPFTGNDTLILFDKGEQITVSTEDAPVRFLLLSGKPIGESVAWYGPIVMNTQEELQVAFDEYNNGTFLKHK
jgi:quercetin 2,3-dioxygenase